MMEAFVTIVLAVAIGIMLAWATMFAITMRLMRNEKFINWMTSWGVKYASKMTQKIYENDDVDVKVYEYE